MSFTAISITQLLQLVLVCVTSFLTQTGTEISYSMSESWCITGVVPMRSTTRCST